MFSPDPRKQPQPEYIAKCGNELCGLTVHIYAHKPGEAENILTEHYWYAIPAATSEGQPISIWICPKCAPIWRARINELKQRLKKQANPPTEPNQESE